MSDWSKLQSDMLRLIARRLHLADDYVRFGVVCKSWHSIYLEKDNSCSLLPWLMLNGNKEAGMCEFYCPFNKHLYDIYRPEIVGRKCWGSPYGWLVTLDKEYKMNLVNPLSRVQIPLPPLHKCSNIMNPICDPIKFQKSFGCKVLLSSSPTSENCVVMAIYGNGVNKIAFSNLGDDTWTPLQCSPNFVDDVIYFHEKFFVVDYPYHVMICDSNGIHFRTVALPETLDADEHNNFAAFVVEMCGQLHVVLKITDIDDTLSITTCTFKVLRLDIYTGNLKDVKNLGNWSIFLGRNSFSLSTSDHPECISNCIYFSDDNDDSIEVLNSWPFAMGIYKLDTCKTQPLLEEETFLRVSELPYWIKPAL